MWKEVNQKGLSNLLVDANNTIHRTIKMNVLNILLTLLSFLSMRVSKEEWSPGILRKTFRIETKQITFVYFNNFTFIQRQSWCLDDRKQIEHFGVMNLFPSIYPFSSCFTDFQFDNAASYVIKSLHAFAHMIHAMCIFLSTQRKTRYFQLVW